MTAPKGRSNSLASGSNLSERLTHPVKTLRSLAFLQGACQPKQPYRGLEYDLTNVSVFSMLLRRKRNRHPTERAIICYGTLPFGKEDRALIAANRYFEKLGMPPFCFAIAGPNVDQPCNEIMIQANPDNWYLNEAFLRTFHAIDRSNLFNGTIVLTPEQCGRFNLKKIVQIYNPEGIVVDVEVSTYVLIPFRHVLSYKLRVDDHWRRKEGFYAEEISYRNADENQVGLATRTIVFYLVPDWTFSRLVEGCVNDFVVDMRPLKEVGIKIHGPVENASVVLGIGYVCCPVMTPVS